MNLPPISAGDLKAISLTVKAPKRKKAQKPKGPYQLTPVAPKGPVARKMTQAEIDKLEARAIPRGPDAQGTTQVGRRFVRTHLVPYLPETLKRATYSALAFQGVSPIAPFFDPLLRDLEL